MFKILSTRCEHCGLALEEAATLSGSTRWFAPEYANRGERFDCLANGSTDHSPISSIAYSARLNAERQAIIGRLQAERAARWAAAQGAPFLG